MYNCLSLPFIELQVDSLNKNRSEMSKSRVYGLKEEREREKKKRFVRPLFGVGSINFKSA